MDNWIQKNGYLIKSLRFLIVQSDSLRFRRRSVSLLSRHQTGQSKSIHAEASSENLSFSKLRISTDEFVRHLAEARAVLPRRNQTSQTSRFRCLIQQPMRLLHILAAALLTGFSAQAQTVPEPSTYTATPTSEVMLQWLHSPNPRLQAWAAHDILLFRSTDLIPDLQSQLDRTTPGTLSDGSRLANFRTTLAMLDTLIQLGAAVPAATLARIEKLGYNSQTEEIVLLTLLPWDEAESAVHSFYKPGLSSDSGETRVAAQLLAQHPPKGFAAELLSTIVVTGRVTVHDANSGSGWGSGSAIGDCGCSAPMTSDWPEVGRYSFQDPPRKGQSLPDSETLFLSAPDPIYLIRTVSRNYYATSCGGFSALNDAIRSHLVGTLLNGNPASPFPEQPVSLDIQFESRESYRAKVERFVDEQQQNFNQIATSLTTLNLLTEEERQAATLRVNLSLYDSRTQPAADLPIITFRPPVQWVPGL